MASYILFSGKVSSNELYHFKDSGYLFNNSDIFFNIVLIL